MTGSPPDPLRTTHLDGPVADRAADWAAGVPFDAYLASVREYPELWESAARRAEVPPDLLARAAALPGRWHLLAIAEDWCIDAFTTVAVLARLAELAPGVELRVLARDEHLALMDEHLTGGTARAIPIALALDGDLVERGWWGPRPAALQAWVKTEGLALEADERYRRIRQWYARDRGRATLEEVVGLLEAAAAARREAA